MLPLSLLGIAATFVAKFAVLTSKDIFKPQKLTSVLILGNTALVFLMLLLGNTYKYARTTRLNVELGINYF